MSVDRRNFIKGVGIAAGVAALSSVTSSRLGGQAFAAPSPSQGQVPGIYRTRVGKIEVTSILDGGMELPLNLFPKTPAQEAMALQKSAFVEPGAVKAYLNAFVLNTGSRLILVDSGGGSAMSETVGKLQQNLAAAGFKTSDFSDIYLTHGHIDHVSGLVDNAGKAVFPQARVRMADSELQFWYDDEALAKAPDGAKGLFAAARKALDPYKASNQIETFKPGADLGGGITTVDLAGHTPGHVGFRVADGKDQLLIWGDIIHAPVLQFAHPEWSIAFDTDAAKALDTRNKILAEVTSDRTRIAGMHLGFPAIGNVAKAGTGYDFVPQIWEV